MGREYTTRVHFFLNKIKTSMEKISAFVEKDQKALIRLMKSLENLQVNEISDLISVDDILDEIEMLLNPYLDINK